MNGTVHMQYYYLSEYSLMLISIFIVLLSATMSVFCLPNAVHVNMQQLLIAILWEECESEFNFFSHKCLN